MSALHRPTRPFTQCLPDGSLIAVSECLMRLTPHQLAQGPAVSSPARFFIQGQPQLLKEIKADKRPSDKAIKRPLLVRLLTWISPLSGNTRPRWKENINEARREEPLASGEKRSSTIYQTRSTTNYEVIRGKQL